MGLGNFIKSILGGSSAKVDNTIAIQQQQEAAAARAKEEARTASIQQGTAKIDNVFGGFDDNFFSDFTSKYMAANQPQLDDQYGDAKEALTFALARAGTLNSGTAGKKSADLTQKYDLARAGLASDAASATDTFRSNVGSEKSGLVSLLNATGDATRATNEALSTTRQFYTKAPTVNPLGDIFAGAASGIGSAVQANQSQAAYDTYLNGGTSAASTAGNAKVVR